MGNFIMHDDEAYYLNNPVAMREVLAAARANEQLAIANGERALEEYHRAEAASRKAEALQRENAELREALKPFARVAPVFDTAVKPAPRNDDHEFYAWQTTGGHVSITVGDFRRARALLGGENAE